MGLSAAIQPAEDFGPMEPLAPKTNGRLHEMTLVQIEPGNPGRWKNGPRLPDFLRKPHTNFQSVQLLKNDLRRLKLHTVCESARCPNMHECFHRGAATFMILGNLCTRGCSFCSVPKGSPAKTEFSLDADEPANVARMAQEMGLKYVVVTSVNRDDLNDGGSRHFAETVKRLREALPEAQIEVLTPDFCGDLGAVARVLDAGPHVFNHNVETVERLYKKVRPQANYQQSLDVIEFAKKYRPQVLTKSGLMAGLGEAEVEVQRVLDDLRAASTEVVTIGQYLQPTRRNMEVAEYVPEDRYERWRSYGLGIGLKKVFAGPFVRSSYMAEQVSEGVRE
jgi:lipoic acid synthetase